MLNNFLSLTIQFCIKKWGNVKKKQLCQATKAILSPPSTGASSFIEYTTERNQTIFKEVKKSLLNIPREERTADHTNAYLQNAALQYDKMVRRNARKDGYVL